MNYLLDTHVLLWWLADSPKLTSEAREVISSPENTIFVSSATAWEIAIKKSIGKLDAPDSLQEVMKKNVFVPLNITISQALEVEFLPNHHNDPFDRLLISQSLHEGLIIITHDKVFEKYKVKTLLV